MDLEGNKLAFDRLITLRGDSDEAWLRAERLPVNLLRRRSGADMPADRFSVAAWHHGGLASATGGRGIGSRRCSAGAGDRRGGRPAAGRSRLVR